MIAFDVFESHQKGIERQNEWFGLTKILPCPLSLRILNNFNCGKILFRLDLNKCDIIVVVTLNCQLFFFLQIFIKDVN